MRTSRLGTSLATILWSTLAYAGAAHGQVVGYQLDRYEPAPAGDGFLVVEAPWYAGTRTFALRLTYEHADQVLGAEGGEPPIATQDYARLDLALAPWERVGFSLSLPLVAAESGTPFGGVGPSGARLGDPRLGARLRLYSWPERDLHLSASAYLWVPIGAEGDLAGDGGVRVSPRLSLSGVADERWRFGVNVGALVRETARLAVGVDPTGNTVGSELQVSGGVNYLALDGRLAVGPEATFFYSLADVPSGQDRGTAELFGSARYAIVEGLDVGVGLGVGLAGAPAPPQWRAMVTISYAPVASRLPRFERVVVLPDEDGHVGGVEVDDGKHKTVLDKAYASSELSRKDKAPRAVQSTPEKEQAKVGPLAQTLPPKDQDGDGVADRDDACPERAGVASTDAIRHGCPKASEKVVVVPDEDGHVGGVEVDDGKSVTVLDQPYSSAEVGSDGAAHAVPPSSAKSVDRSVAGVAKTLPPGDLDDDGVIDAADACPDRAGGASSDPVRNGCPPSVEKVVVLPDPDGHVGGVEVDDGKSVTVLDKPYASAEVGADGTVQAVPPAPPKAVDKSVAPVAKTMPIADDDGDGVRDELDACPARAGVASTDPVRNGCPKASEKVVVLPDADGHVGGVEVDDGKGKTVLDQPYATSEVGQDGRARAVPASNGAAAKRSVAGVARTMPIADRDDDGVADADDACAERAGAARAGDPSHNGCPKAVEKVVVLPDQDGHVGGVEVDDGSGQVVVLDQAYGTAEIGADGRSRKIESPSAEVATEFAPALAAQPSGARIILYFDSRAQPVRDISGPVASVVAEVKDKETYRVEVVGHTDQTGSRRKNKKIGLERAQYIADGLVAAGIPRERIVVISKGDTDPAVKTKSRRQAELRNRRVEVFVIYETKPASK